MFPILESKKFQAAVVAVFLAFAGYLAGFSTEQVLTLIGPILIYIGGQGLADVGKEKARMETQGPVQLGEVVMAAVKDVVRQYPPPNFSGQPVKALFPSSIAQILQQAGYATVEELRNAPEAEVYENLTGLGLTRLNVQGILDAVRE